MRKSTLLSVLFLCLSLTIYGQSFELGASFGGSWYDGDLSPNGNNKFLQTTHPAFGGFVRLGADSRISTRIGFTYGTISGADSLRTTTTERSLSFRSELIEVSAVLEWNIVHWEIGRSGLVVSPYLYGGAALYQFNPQTYFDGRWVDLHPLGTEGQGLEGYAAPYNTTQAAIPFGGGVKVTLSDTWGIGFDFGSRKTFTDYLDDLGSATVNYGDILNGNGELAAQLSNPTIKPGSENTDVTYRRGGPADDWYYIGTLSVTYHLGQADRRQSKRSRAAGYEGSCYKF